MPIPEDNAVSDNMALALVTCPPEQAETLATVLVDARVAACVNIAPTIRSVYRWQGKVQCDNESLLLIKFPSSGFEALRQQVLAAHPYELPEIVAVDIQQAHTPYLQWVLDACR